jgi:hypothetical protein
MKTTKPSTSHRGQRDPIARRRICPPGALITNPEALLEAMAKALSKAQQPVEARHTKDAQARATVRSSPAALELVPPPPISRPSLHENERIAHAPSSGTVVIIRRRRAA